MTPSRDDFACGCNILFQILESARYFASEEEMTSWTLARRSLVFYLRSHLGTIAGAAIATAVLTGALLVGDSVRESLRQMALSRLGKIDFAMASGDRVFRAALADDLQKKIGSGQVAPALQVPGTVSNPDGNRRANHVQVTGVDGRFWQLANTKVPFTIGNNAVFVNARLAQQLNVGPGQTILLRVPRITHLSRDAPLAPEENAAVALRLQVDRVLSDDEFGRFGLQASQVAPFNAFVPLPLLQSEVKATNQANLILVHAEKRSEELQSALASAFQLEDAQLQLLSLEPRIPEVELRSPRVFLDKPISEAAVKAGTNARPVLTYFVNELRHANRATPYSMVTGGASLVPPEMKDDEIIINQWLADDLAVKPGDHLVIRYFVMGFMRDLIEKTNTFRVHQIVPMQLPYVDPSLMPDFPGMSDAKNCRDWDTGFPINTDAIRDKDEEYWHKYRGSPKAFVTLRAAQQLWSNRFGNLTAVRYPIGNLQSSQGEVKNTATPGREAKYEQKRPILAFLKPADIGFVFQSVRRQALAASSGAQDFGELFLGFSFFLIAAALMLMALLFRFALEQRGVEIGTLLALGFKPKNVKRMLLLEGGGLAVIGGVIGVIGGALYAKAMLYGLSTVWRDAIAGSALQYFAKPQTLVTGFCSGVIVGSLTIWWSLRKEAKRPARELLNEGMESEFPTEVAAPKRSILKKAFSGMVIGSITLFAGVGTVVWGLMNPQVAQADLFFSAGSLILVSGLALSSALIGKLEHSRLAVHLSVTGMGLRSMTRRRTRSRATIALLACGAFLIASIGAFHLDTGKEMTKRSSGTGGFALLAESSIAVVHNLNAQAGRDFYGLNAKELDGVSFVPLRVLPGDDASCLNLNLAQRPRLLGVNPELLNERRAFTFSEFLKSFDGKKPWLMLDADLGPDVAPAIGDAASIQYAMKKKVGETIDYTDSNGRQFKVKIVGAVANSILQGSLIVSEKQFVSHFPTESGYRMFLIDAPSNSADALAATLSKAMQDAGIEVTKTNERLAAFNAVQNTYLGTFQMLGGLGLLLGSFGLGIVLLRNVFERRSELALLLAVGFRKSTLRWLILSEHATLLLMGLIVGVIAAAIAVLPALITPGRQLPFFTLGLTLSAILVCGLIWTVVAASISLRAPLLPALRNE
jgi:putative ABC transport system permease protein